MKNGQLMMMYAAAGATTFILGGAPALAKRQGPSTTIIGERATEDQLSVQVSYRDLNLAAARDERILNRRAGKAVRTVCKPHHATAIGDYAFFDCVGFAWNGARPQIALAVRRAHEIAASGPSSIPLVAIAIVAPN